jgi:hypothetical protein
MLLTSSLSCPKWTIHIYLFIVGVVAAYDWGLTVIYAPCLHGTEENPIGRWLMGARQSHVNPCESPPHILLFLALKVVGTSLVLSVMHQLFSRCRRIGHPVAIGVSVAQLLLAVYLTIG